MLIMLGALIAQVNTNPYTTSALNAIEFCSLCFTVLIMVCGMAFRVVRSHHTRIAVHCSETETAVTPC